MTRTKLRPISFATVVTGLLLLCAAGCARNAVPDKTAGVPAAAPAGKQADAGPPWANQWARDSVFYEVFVRSFQDSNGDGVGDLRGLIARLDELNDGDPQGGNDLGVTGLWLMPVFASPSYHGYDVTDYRAINPDYGTLDDFKQLLQEAHKRGIRVIVDFVINHSSAQHPWFAESASSPTSPKRDWYLWRKDDPGWTQPWGGSNRTWHKLGDEYFLGLFWGGMPDLKRPMAEDGPR